MAEFRFSYFDRFLELTLPDDALVRKLDVVSVPAIGDVYTATAASLRRPIGVAPLKESVERGSRVLVVVPDKSRRTDIREMLRAVLDELSDASVSNERITILIALGTHRPMTREEIAAKIGNDTAGRFRVVNHDWDDPSQLVDLGCTADGLPVQFNRLITEHDFIISIGAISAHPVGGYSGGAKGLLPGIAGKRSTDYFHWKATAYPLFDIFGNPDNPVRNEMEKIVDAVGLRFIVNAVENAERRICGIFAGHFIEAHRAGVRFLQQRPLIAYPAELPDILMVGMGDDRPDFWAGAAGIYAASALLKDGGIAVLLAACPEGVAPEHPLVLEYGYPRWKEAVRDVERGLLPDRTGASHLVTVGKILEQKKIRVFLVSEGINQNDAERLGFFRFDSAESALSKARESLGGASRILAYERI